MKHLRFLVYSSLLIMAGCSSDSPDVPNDDHTKVNLTTRAENPTDGSTLQAGLYMVNYFDGQPDELMATNNYVNNLPLIWQNNAWAVTTPFYWNDMFTPADFYAYSPYQSAVEDARQMPFSVQTDQRSNESFARSDFYWGTVLGQSPTAEGFNLTLEHQLSRLVPLSQMLSLIYRMVTECIQPMGQMSLMIEVSEKLCTHRILRPSVKTH